MKPKEKDIKSTNFCSTFSRIKKNAKAAKVFSTNNVKTVLTDKGGLKGGKVYTL